MPASVQEHRCVEFACHLAEQRRAADMWWSNAKARRDARLGTRMIYDNHGGHRACYVRGVSQRLPMSESESKAVRSYIDEGGDGATIDGFEIQRGFLEREPGRGWVACQYCTIPMPAGKAEECVPVSHTRLFAFYHAACYEESLKPLWRRQPYTVGKTASSRDEDAGSSERESPTCETEKQSAWDLDKPDFASYD
eukprot:jgi/Mesvir1/18329/Mv18482-RA.1